MLSHDRKLGEMPGEKSLLGEQAFRQGASVSAPYLATVEGIELRRPEPSPFSGTSIRQDAVAFLALLESRYAYANRFPDSAMPVRAELEWAIPHLQTRNDLIAFIEQAFHALHDHHNISGHGRSDAYGLVPSFADLWIKFGPRGYVVTDVRQGSAALKAGIRPGDLLSRINHRPVASVVQEFIGPTGAVHGDARRDYAARVLAAGRRDRDRHLGFETSRGPLNVRLPSLYRERISRTPGLVSVDIARRSNGKHRTGIVRLNDSLGDEATIAAFDEALTLLSGTRGLVVDLRDTASGGTALVARGLLSRFTTSPRAYQRHHLPCDARDFGVPRSWLEEVHPRKDAWPSPVAVLVGRWTASMGEGLALGFDALGIPVIGSAMAGLRGGVSTHKLPHTGVEFVLTTEALSHIDGTPREVWLPRTLFNYSDAPNDDGQDGPLEKALQLIDTSAA